MAAELWVNDNGTARKLQEIWVNDNGTARQIQEIWVNDNGTARLIYQGLTITLPSATFSRGGGSPCEFQLNSDGNRYARESASLTNRGAWINNASLVGQFECRATLTSGSLTSGTTGAWQSLSTSRSWTRGAGTNQFQTCTFTLEIRNASTSAVVATASITLECDQT